jgi:hypothetical protein
MKLFVLSSILLFKHILLGTGSIVTLDFYVAITVLHLDAMHLLLTHMVLVHL